MDTKTESNLNNIITTLSLISISSVKKFAGKCPQTWSQLLLMNSSLRCSRMCHKIPVLYRRFCLSATQTRWMPKLVSIDTQSYAALTSQYLRSTIGRKTIDLFSTTSLECQESYNRNVTLQALELFSVLSHGSIMPPPRQPRIFAWLARWQ